jgi:hypothetical protein
VGRSEVRRQMREFLQEAPKQCCECRGRFRPAIAEETVVIQETLMDGDWPAEVKFHSLIGAVVCVSCGHVMVLTHGGDTAVIWCPGFGVHGRVVASAN